MDKALWLSLVVSILGVIGAIVNNKVTTQVRDCRSCYNRADDTLVMKVPEPILFWTAKFAGRRVLK